MTEPTEKCKFCGAETTHTNDSRLDDFTMRWYACGGNNFNDALGRSPDCYERQIEQQLAMLRKCLDNSEWCPGCDCDLMALPQPKHAPDCELASMLQINPNPKGKT